MLPAAIGVCGAAPPANVEMTDVLLRLRNERGTHQCKAARTLLVVFVFPLLPGDIERQRT